MTNIGMKKARSEPGRIVVSGGGRTRGSAGLVLAQAAGAPWAMQMSANECGPGRIGADLRPGSEIGQIQ